MDRFCPSLSSYDGRRRDWPALRRRIFPPSHSCWGHHGLARIHDDELVYNVLANTTGTGALHRIRQWVPVRAVGGYPAAVLHHEERARQRYRGKRI